MADTLSLCAFLPHDLWIEVPFHGKSAHFDKLYDNRQARNRTFVLDICEIPGVDVNDLCQCLARQKNWHKLKFSPPIQAEVAIERKINPKRMQREIQSQLQDKGIGTKAQQALKLQHEQCKLERKTKSREQKEAEKDRQFAIRQEKKKAKHRGR